MRAWFGWVVVGCVVVAGCDGGESAAVDASRDGAVVDMAPDMTSVDMASPDMTSPDMTSPDMASPDMASPDMGAPPAWAAPSADGVPTPVVVDRWVRATLPLPTDPLRDRFERGDVFYPAGPRGEDGVTWAAVPALEDGSVPGFGAAEGYMVARVEVPAGHSLIGRADRSAAIYTAGAIQPGDVYGSNTSLFPLVNGADDGEVVVAVRPYPQRGVPRVQLFATPDAIVFNVDDLTFPDLRVGDDETHWLGVPVLETRGAVAGSVVARVVESDVWQGTEVRYAGLPAGAATQLGFELRPKAAWGEAGVEVPVTVEVSSPDLAHDYRRTLTLTTREAAGAYRQTFREATDGSVQYYGVNPPPVVEEGVEYGLALSLHGAGVEGIGQARAYAAKDDMYIVAPTNRRRFGFDWEAWGRFNGLASLDDAMARYAIDPTRVYLTGHSMGGHGTWHLGVTTPGRFAVVGPSAGWASFETYAGIAIPDGIFGRARAHSRTLDYVQNLARRAVYIIHGSADDNVSVREGRSMFAAVGAVTDDIDYHEQEGAGHWWNVDPEGGADCVDWPPLFELMRARRLDPWELDFTFRTPSPGYSSEHSVVRIEAAETPLEDVVVTGARAGGRWVLTTQNARRLVLDGAALGAQGVAEVEVNGEVMAVVDGPMAVGPATGKSAALSGPLAQGFRRPFCFVWAEGEHDWRRVAGYWASYWQLVGNGHACGMTLDRFEAGEGVDDYNGIRLGSAADVMQMASVEWDAGGVAVDGQHFPETALVMVRPDGMGRLGAALVAAEGWAHLLLRVVPFGSTAGLPDYLVFGDDGGRAVGFFDYDWQYDGALSLP